MKNRFIKISIAVSALFFIAVFAFFVFGFYIIKDLPPIDLIENHKVAETTKIFDRTGEVLLYEIHGDEKRIVIPFSSIPDRVKQATVAIEDVNFYNHSAFDIKGIIRAFFKNLSSGQFAQGGSTITQQLVKNAFLSPEKTITRKIKELVLAIQLEQRVGKDKILELYLNQIPYGSNAYGIEAASQTFFEKSTGELNLAEAALIASLPKAPTFYSPWGQNREALFARQKNVLSKMYELNFISEKEKEEALKTELNFAKPSFGGIKAPHFVIMVQGYLINKYGEDFVRTNGLRVKTTIDWELQQFAEEAVLKGADRNTELYGGKNAALVAQDPKTGQVLALVGSRDYFDTENDGNFNVAYQGLRQPGSAFKPFVYVSAFKKGYTPETVVFDLETEFNTTNKDEDSYKPVNFTDNFSGPITLRNALAQSVNVPAVKVLYLTGLSESIETAKNFGINTLGKSNRYGLSLVLGGGEVKLIELVDAYSVFSQNGIKHKQSIILEVKNKTKILEKYADLKERVIDARYTSLINDILSDQKARAPLFGNSLLLNSFPEHQIAVKTGTTNDYRDAWSIGYTPSLVVGVWAGNNDNSPMLKRGSSIFASVPIWKDFMEKALKNYGPEVFEKPEQSFPNKPVLNNKYVINYKSGDEIYPQIHTILFYLNKNNPKGPEPKNPEDDPQFYNWENPVLKWALENIENFFEFNKPIPAGSVLVSDDINLNQNLSYLDIINPENGSFIDKFLNLEFSVNLTNDIKKGEVYLNGSLVDSFSGNSEKTLVYKKSFDLESIESQNIIKVFVFDDNDIKYERSVIFFHKS